MGGERRGEALPRERADLDRLQCLYAVGGCLAAKQVPLPEKVTLGKDVHNLLPAIRRDPEGLDAVLVQNDQRVKGVAL